VKLFGAIAIVVVVVDCGGHDEDGAYSARDVRQAFAAVGFKLRSERI
jgi:hypothetical protein